MTTSPCRTKTRSVFDCHERKLKLEDVGSSASVRGLNSDDRSVAARHEGRSVQASGCGYKS